MDKPDPWIQPNMNDWAGDFTRVVDVLQTMMNPKPPKSAEAGVYADWLEELGFTAAAKALRDEFALRPEGTS